MYIEKKNRAISSHVSRIMSKSLKMFLKPQGTGARLGQTDGQIDAGNNNTLSA